MSLSTEFLDEIRARVSLAGVVGRKVKLVKRGREHSGLCPFHNEKSPSFTVSEDKGFFHCFGCGAHGDVIGFVMRTEGLAFPEAAEKLANEAGLQMPVSTPMDREAAQRRADLYEVLDAATGWFQEQLHASGGEEARAYLERRGLSPETTALFRLGLAPDSRGALRKAMNARGYDDDQLVDAGLMKRPDSDEGSPRSSQSLRDYFFNRITFPITDRRGRVIAFGGRALGDSKAKYLNSPETTMFHKGRVLYNMARARQAAHDTGEVIVVEGYMDVIALAQAGFPAAVAPLGTAVTEEQIEELWRMAPRPTMCLDGDAAGQRAGFRAATRALPMLKPGCSLGFAVLPPNEDPDSLVNSRGAAAFRQVLDSAQPLAEVVWRMTLGDKPMTSPEDRAALRVELRKTVAQIADPDLKAEYGREMDQRVQQAFGGNFSGGGGGARHRDRGGKYGGAGKYGRGGSWDKSSGRRRGWGDQATTMRIGALQSPEFLRRRQDQVLLATLVNHPKVLLDYAEDLALLRLEAQDLDHFRQALLDLVAREPDLDSDALKCHLSEQGYSGLLGELLSSDVYVHGKFARPATDSLAAREGIGHVLAVFRERQAAEDTEEAARQLAVDMSEDHLARVRARQELGQEDEGRTIDLDRFAAAGSSDLD
ncbi:DNA primase [Denitrobaculum tricleocarpae]|uniref:DNA primase n=1 Tax=Denitrobaculum tricleocarpae TaxID=2591009 RepID=A0A545SZA2_9PROT|nr:DNA primase [Denitrobaculum tricleocarpae]TQV70249.1 DNA primase [Denitrobaculum tricleocarpae]